MFRSLFIACCILSFCHAAFAIGFGDELGPDDPYCQQDLPRIKAKAEHGEALAEAQLGANYFQGICMPQNLAMAAKWWEKSAEQGNVQAQAGIGGMYWLGKGVPKDVVRAVKWLRAAAESGHPGAQATYGAILFEGLDVPKNEPEAVKFLKSSADKGVPFGQCALAVAYQKGAQGLAKNLLKADMWARLSTSGDGSAAQTCVETRKEIEHSLTPAQLDQVSVAVETWNVKHCGLQSK